MSCLLETLQKVLSNVSPDAADRRFIEQLLMSATENVVEHFPVSLPTTMSLWTLTHVEQASTLVPPGAIRVDALVEILRSKFVHMGVSIK